MNGKFLLLGSNLGNRENNIKTALRQISEKIGRISALSSVYSSSAWGLRDQPDFLNQAIKIETRLEPEKLLHEIGAIENSMGRQRKGKWTSRIIDIDILYYDNVVMDQKDLQIPHPRIPDRKFTLLPLAELAPGEIHPVLGLSNNEMLSRTKDDGKVEKYNKQSFIPPDSSPLPQV
jgi:2-amino-4-hydroxy-6-hydroxymethyldihydropteridine diphosphokinase